MRSLPFLTLLCPLLATAAEDPTDFFEKNIRPVLARQCYACHSEKSKPVQGDLLVDSREGLARGGKSGIPALIPGKPAESLLIKAIRGTHKDLKMPPGKPLDEPTVAAFTKWVEMGAPDPRSSTTKYTPPPAYNWDKEKQHWAYQPIRSVTPPTVTNPEWSRTPIDRFIKTALDQQGLQPLPRASKLTLLRRVTYSLTGLPPTPADTAAFLADASPAAYEKLIDRLLASPAYGEHWGRKWLDLVRYADTAGDASDFPVPELYRYRNYVIRSLNADKPFDVFLREQLAGDLLPHRDLEDRREKVIATSYLALSRRFGQTTGEFYLTLDDTVDNLSKTFLGLTVGCARCHDHKFDPIPTTDYYALTGIFKSTNYAHSGLEHHQYLEHFTALDPQDQPRLNQVQSRMIELFKLAKHDTPPAGLDKDKLLEFHQARAEFNRLRQNFPAIPMAFAVSDGPATNAQVMIKGDPTTLGPVVPRGFLTILGGQQVPATATGSGRDLLADWLLAPANPLTTRVFVNRVWLGHFGRGLVNSPNDFGTRGEAPSHPELLDYLATRFRADGFSLKQLHKQILLSRTYQTASGHHPTNAVKDAKNAFYWRFDRRRLTAEEIRDTMLATSGQLDPTMPNAHPFPPRGSYVFTQHNPFVADLDKFDHRHRSVYLLQQRFRRNPYLELFDGPDPNNTTPARSSDTSALQSLYFLNNDFVARQAEALAARVALDTDSLPARIQQAYRLLFTRPATPLEVTAATQLVAKVEANTQDRKLAWTSLMRALLASNEFFYLD